MTDPITQILLLIIFLLLNSAAVFGFNIATSFDFVDEQHPEKGIMPDSRMILWKFRYWCIVNLGYFWSKPVCLCPPCMASIHSTYFYLFFLTFVHFDLKWILFYPVYILILSGVNYFVGLKTEGR